MAEFPPAPNLIKARQGLTLNDSEGAPVKVASLWAKQTCLVRHVRSFASLGCRGSVKELFDQRLRLEQYQVKTVLVLPEESAKAKQWKAEMKVPFLVLADPEKLSFLAVGAKQINWGTPENIRGMSKTSLSTSVRLNNDLRFMPTTHVFEPDGRVTFCWLNTTLKDDCKVAQVFQALDAG